MRTFGEWLKDQRAQHDPPVSLREMAQRVGVSPSFVSDLENDRRSPSESMCEKLAAHYGVPLDEFYGHAGIIGESAERYLKRSPKAVQIIREMAQYNLSERRLAGLYDYLQLVMCD